MKISLSWIFDHINADWKTLSIPDLTAQFTSKVAEFDHVQHIRLDFTDYSFASITHKDAQEIRVYSKEWNASYILPLRADTHLDLFYLIHKDALNKTIRWATAKDVGGQKDDILPAFEAHEALLSSKWKHTVELEDYVLEIDNKSINHRPDLWGHRGCAREIAALFELPFKPLTALEQDTTIHRFDTAFSATQQNQFSIEIKDLHACNRFAGVYMEFPKAYACDLFMSFRLARIDMKPISLFVDATNYVMCDLAQPLHAYDAKTITSGLICPRFAKNNETLKLLDGQTIKLSDKDFVITDGYEPLGLAGIMGGVTTCVTEKTLTLFIEAACFDATLVRQSALRHKLRTQASTRFEKGLDPEQTGHGLRRIIKLLQTLTGTPQPELYIASVGTSRTTISVTLSHDALEKRLGTTVTPSKVIDILQRLEFCVAHKDNTYTIEVPSFRASGDVSLQEDIIEEIGRFVGYESIKPFLPKRATEPIDTYELYRLRTMRTYLAYGLSMNELSSYAFFDEQFLRELAWQPGPTLEVANPLSEQWKRLVTSLIPHMIRAVVTNVADHDTMRFFECATIWNPSLMPYEQLSLAGIFFNKKKSVDFYEMQDSIISLLAALSIDNLTWKSVEAPEQVWFMPYQTADIIADNTVIGRAGKINPSFLHTVTEGDAYVFELNANFLKEYRPAPLKYQQTNKYPDVVRDISILVPLEYTVQDIKQSIRNCHQSIVFVDLIDSFYKPEWGDQKSLTFRYLISDTTKTVTKLEIDGIHDLITQKLSATYGAQIR